MAEDFVDSILRCGLYLGAIFQLIFIAAAVVIPDKSVDSNSTNCIKELEVSDDEGSDNSTPQATPRRPHVHHINRRKQEKKKRR